MPAANLTSQDSILRTLYPQKEIQRLWYKNNPLYAIVPKRNDFYGKNMVLALRYSETGGRSADPATAQANKSPAALSGFTITRAKDYSYFSIDGETLVAGSKAEGAIVESLETEIDAAMDALKRSVSSGLYRNGGGAIGQIDATTTLTGTTLVLKDPNSIVNFGKNNWIQLSATDGTSGSVRTGSLQIVGIARGDGTAGSATLTLSGNINTIPGAASQDYIFQAGDFGLKVKGLDAWIPSTTPSATLFFGVDRTADTVRLGGNRVTGTAGAAIEENLQRAMQQGYRNGATPSHIFLNDFDYFQLAVSLGSRVYFTPPAEETTDAGIGFKGLQITGPNGTAKCFSDPNCQQGTGWCLDMSTWSLRYPGEFPMFLNKDGNKILRDVTADAYEGRIGGYFQLMTDAPGYNSRIAL